MSPSRYYAWATFGYYKMVGGFSARGKVIWIRVHLVFIHGLWPMKAKAVGVKNVRRNKKKIQQGNGSKAAQQNFQRTRQNSASARVIIRSHSKQWRVNAADCPVVRGSPLNGCCAWAIPHNLSGVEVCHLTFHKAQKETVEKTVSFCVFVYLITFLLPCPRALLSASRSNYISRCVHCLPLIS